jgi:hypothetical protein
MTRSFTEPNPKATAVLAVDPGGTTGYSIALNGEFTEAGQLPPLEFQTYAHEFAENWGPQLTIVCERFTISGRTLKVSRAGSMSAIEVIGCLRYFSETYCDRDLLLQSPDDAMGLYTDAKLKLLGWWQPGKGHANDSLRHLAYYLTKIGAIKVPTL